MQLGKISLTSNAVLAPIAGYTDVGFRAICAMCGAGLTYTEMISAKGLVYGSEKTADLLNTTKYEKNTAVQIFGSEPYFIKQAVEHEALQKFDIIDINMGCPMPKITKNGDGSALLENIDLAQQVVKAAKISNKVVTAKMRIGVKDNIAVEFAKGLNDAGVDAITVHGRTREQMYSGTADWNVIADVVKAVNIPVIANGDVFTKNDYDSILEKTNASGVMIARGALGNPNIFSEIIGKEKKALKDLIVLHLDILLQYHSERYVLLNFRKHMACYTKGLVGNKELKRRAMQAQSIKELKLIIGDMSI